MEVDSDLREQVGHLRGRVEGVEAWLGRLDSSVMLKLDNLDRKISDISEKVSAQSGGHSVLSYLWIGGGGAAIGYVALHALNIK
jgi:hypothetical protein